MLGFQAGLNGLDQFDVARAFNQFAAGTVDVTGLLSCHGPNLVEPLLKDTGSSFRLIMHILNQLRP